MNKYLTPLWVFVGGQIVALLCFLFLPAIGTASGTLSNPTWNSAFWNWTWISNVSVVKFVVMSLIEALTLYATAKAFLAIH
jgi:hypothetical protein